MNPDVAFVGLGMTELGKVYGRTATDFAAEAVVLALADAGLEAHDLDGLLINASTGSDLGLSLQNVLGLRDLGLLCQLQSFGASVGAMVLHAAAAIEAGLATTVALVYADCPLKPGGAAADPYGRASRPVAHGMAGLDHVYGNISVNIGYAMAAQRHMSVYGTTSEQLGAVAVAARQWAQHNPHAQQRNALTIADHQASRWIAEPLRLLDCCLVTNGAIALIVTSAERATDLRQPPVFVIGLGQGHPGNTGRSDQDPLLRTGAAISGGRAMGMAGVGVDDVDMCQIYDCYTYTTLVTLEDYGFCKKGDGGDFVMNGRLAPGGPLPTNTGGGQLSAYYMWGMTPLSEAVIQGRGHAGPRQVSKRDVILVSGNGGVLATHATLVLSGRAR